MFLSVFPFLLVALITFIAPKFYDSVRSSEIFGPAIFVGLFLLVAGNFIMFRLVNFKY